MITTFFTLITDYLPAFRESIKYEACRNTQKADQESVMVGICTWQLVFLRTGCNYHPQDRC